jgi:hypothetical protein
MTESKQNPQEPQEPQNARREFLRSGAKLAYIIPAVVAATVGSAEARETSGAPV